MSRIRHDECKLITHGRLIQSFELEAAQQAEMADEGRIVFLYEVWLDRDDTLEKLSTILEGEAPGTSAGKCTQPKRKMLIVGISHLPCRLQPP